MRTKRPSTALSFYDKATMVTALEKTRNAVEESLQTFEQELADWRAHAPEKFVQYVNKYNPDRSSRYMGEFEPPMKKEVCKDYRVRQMTQVINRISMMTPNEDGAIGLRRDDEVWGIIGMEDCS